jgi:hypothetical protein
MFKRRDSSLSLWFLKLASWREPKSSATALAAITTILVVIASDIRNLFDLSVYAHGLSWFVALRVGCWLTAEAATFISKFTDSWRPPMLAVAGYARSVSDGSLPSSIEAPDVDAIRRSASSLAQVVWRAQTWLVDALSLRHPVGTVLLMVGVWTCAVLQPLMTALVPVAVVLVLLAGTHGLWQGSIGVAVCHAVKDLVPSRWAGPIIAVLEFDYAAMPARPHRD